MLARSLRFPVLWLAAAWIGISARAVLSPGEVHVWETQEITLRAARAEIPSQTAAKKKNGKRNERGSMAASLRASFCRRKAAFPPWFYSGAFQL
jgi:hypothetical protein